jgi:hypothetical protein
MGGLGDQTPPSWNPSTPWTPPPGYEYVTGVRQRQQQCASPLPWMPFDQNFGYYLDPQTVQAAGYAGPGSEGVPFPVFAAWAAFLLGTAAGYKAIRRNYEKSE